MAKNTIIKKSIFHVLEDGTSATEVRKIVFDPEDPDHLFRLELPGYVAKHFNLESSLLMSPSVGPLVEKYERYCDEYSRWRLSMNAPWLLWLQVESTPVSFAMQSIGLGMELVKAMPDGTICTFEDDGTIGKTYSTVGKIIIPDSPEHRLKATQLVDSIRAASQILTGLQNAADPMKYLMEISETWGQEPPAAQMELPLEGLAIDKPATDTKSVDLSDL